MTGFRYIENKTHLRMIVKYQLTYTYTHTFTAQSVTFNKEIEWKTVVYIISSAPVY